MRPINCIIEDVRSEASHIRTFRLDETLPRHQGSTLWFGSEAWMRFP